MERREFLQGAAWLGATAVASGCLTKGLKVASGGLMQGYHDKPFDLLRVAVIGLSRGGCAANFAKLPHCRITCICDLEQVRVDNFQKTLAAEKHPKAAEFTGAEDWKRICERDDVDLVYNATPWQLHVPIALYAMEHGKHVVTEVPSAFTLDDCWKLVETSERTRRHCMQLENCSYGEEEMLALNLVRKGLLGELVHGEGAYIHDLRKWNYGDFNPADSFNNYWNFWRLRWNTTHAGNQYCTHGLGPICNDMDINHGDRFDYLVSVDSPSLGFKDYATHAFKDEKNKWKANLNVAMADMNNTIIKTVKGRTILVQHDVANARPYDRLNLISGTRGILQGYPFRCALESEDKVGEGIHEYDAKFAKEVMEKYRHPLWQQAGDLAKKFGGHGGMDFIMILRLAYCLQCGLPLDTDVYDLATWCCLGELTETSARNRGRSMDVPDFTRGGWKTAKPADFGAVDLAKMGLKV